MYDNIIAVQLIFQTPNKYFGDVRFYEYMLRGFLADIDGAGASECIKNFLEYENIYNDLIE